MKHIVIKGRSGSGKTTEAMKLYEQEAAGGKHVMLIDDGDVRRSSHAYPAALFWGGAFSPDVLIRTKTANHPLKVSIFHAPAGEPRNYSH